MVRDHVLSEDDLVRPQYSKEWQTADSVVGLFNMAQRVPAPRAEVAPIESQSCPAFGTDLSLENVQFGRSYTLDEVNHKLVSAKPFDLEAEECFADVSSDLVDQIDPGIEVGESQAGSEMADAIAVAAKDWDRRHIGPVEVADQPNQMKQSTGLFHWILLLFWRTTVGMLSMIKVAVNPLMTLVSSGLRALSRSLRLHVLCRLLERVAARQTLSWWFRIGCALSVGGLVAYAIISWSVYEDLKYPDVQRLALGKRVFPLFGPCLPVEFTFMLTDAILAGGILGYFGARGLESLAED